MSLLDIRLDCENLVVQLTHAQDHDQAERAAALFIEGGVWVRSGVEHKGREAIIASFDRGGREVVVRHIVSSCLVEPAGPDRATAVTYYLAYVSTQASGPVRRLETPASMGEWRDEFVRTPDGWRFSRREGKRIFER